MGQHVQFFDDGINPKFVFHTQVSSLELESDGTLSTAGVMRHVQSAIDTWCDGAREPFVVSDSHLETLTPVAGPVMLRIDVWVDELDSISCTYGFVLSSEDGQTAFARGDRTIRKVENVWTGSFRARNESLRKDLPAYA
jgi:hypothetical protein